ncbi:hypothetical protein KP004_08370 [Geomonas oryzisoli]|uniref:Lipoprotein n=1 Tax=Geomonas oryzisoli TaxID=2847992 RepID=A0ABX8JA27_9BACT|nr:hypothetical protein [Geomonas oryzisoli]QWV95178.1 hypothetical protein KP004_08370 [Geomonas oryzisoli]
MSNLDRYLIQPSKYDYRLFCRTAAFLASCFLLSGCMCPLKSPPDPGVKFYQSLDSVQCTGGGKTVAQIERDVRAAGITVYQTSCGVDGAIYPSVCGAPDGRLAVLEIPLDQARAASALGLKPLFTLPYGAETPCR